MDDEEIFQQMMDSLGVDPIERPGQRRSKAESSPLDAAEAVAAEPSEDDEDSLFLDTMSGLDVAFAGDRPPRPPASEEEPPEAETGEELDELEDSVFLDSMDALATPPDKDLRAPRPKPRPQKVRLPKRRTPEVDETLDLHGQTVEQALSHLRRFLASAILAHSHTVLVVTGKGHHSESGRGVLRQEVERWLRRDSAHWVHDYSEAPRALGGSGAFVVRLR